MKKYSVNLLLVLLALVLLFLTGEFLLRGYHLIKYNRPLLFAVKGNRQPIYLEEKLGWRATENYSFQGVKKDAGGKEYYVDNTTNQDGFKVFGDNPSGRRRILFIGDSYTQAIDISNNKTYYGLIAQRLKDVTVFAYGVGSYGTLQEYLIIDEFIDRIKPDILLLQFCCNDFINNDYDLDKASYLNNCGTMRPYLDSQGNIFYKNPKHLYIIPDILFNYSRLIFYISNTANRLLSLINQNKSIELVIHREGPTHAGFTRSLETTKRILGMIQTRAAGVDFYTFSVDIMQPFYDEYKKLCASEGYKFIDGIPHALQEYEGKGLVARVADKSHLNELGHRIVADKILDYFQAQGVLKASRPSVASGEPTN
ncbi:MAG: SGNH/GDSL hydrolase family protein [Thermodesulfobacteriota bacterium]